MSASPQTGDSEATCGSCVPLSAAEPVRLSTQIALLQWITIGWMLIECAVSLIAAARSHSVALLVFGSDSLIELLSATVVLLQFVPRFPLDRSRAQRIAALLLYALAVVVVLLAALSYRAHMESSSLGIGITIAALVAMPVLAALKRKEARKRNDHALAADAAQSATCAYLAAVTLAGLAAFSYWHIAWVDSVAALAAVPILILEGRRAWRGHGCGCGA